MTTREFGRTDDGTVHEVRLTAANGATASLLTFGATLRDLVVPLDGKATRRVVLGYDDFEGYRTNPPFLGAMCGRSANRIAGGRFRLDGREVKLLANEGANTLHGGPRGFSHRLWRLDGSDETSAEFTLVSEDGDQGFPGRVTVRCRYDLRVVEDATELAITATAFAEAPTPVNLANHAYFNLADLDDARDHLLQIAADFYTPADEGLIPTGAILPVAGTRFDFRRPRPIGENYDDGFVLRGAPGAVVPAAVLAAPDGSLSLEIETDQPGLQLYTAQHLGDFAAPQGGRRHRPNGAVCLESQGLVDAPNERHFPSTILRPGACFRWTAIHRFRAG